jgi:TldD protein
MEDILSKTLDLMLLNGAEFCDAKVQTIDSLGIRVVDGAVRSLSDNRLKGVCLRARIGGAWGYGSTVSMEEADIRTAAERAVLNARVSELPGQGIDSKAIVKDVRADVSIHPKEVALEEKIALLMEIDSAQAIDGIVNRNSMYGEEVRENLLMNSLGSKVSWEEVRLRLKAHSISGRDGRNEMYYYGPDTSFGYEVVKGADPNEIGGECARRAVAALDSKRPPSGMMTVITDPMVSGLLAHEVMGHASEADEIVKKRSFLTGVVGKKVASELITMVDDGTVPGAHGTLPFDDEGTPASKTTIIQDGVYKGYMHSLETAMEMDVAPTGNGRAQDFGRRVWVRMTNTYFDKGDWSLEEMLEDVKYGIICDKMINGMEDPVGGGFEAKVLRGFLIENGRITDQLSSFTVTGKALEILNTTDAVGKDVSLDGGTCGKGIEDWVPVSSGGPYCRSQIIVGGG